MPIKSDLFVCHHCEHVISPPKEQANQTPAQTYKTRQVATGITPPLSYAPFWKRALAYIIDVVVYLIVNGIIMMLIIDLGIIVIYVPLLTWFLFKTIMESSALQGTVGKFILGIQVTDLNGNRIRYGRSVLRFLGTYLSSILCIGFLMTPFTEKNQALHDLLADTIVINKKVES